MSAYDLTRLRDEDLLCGLDSLAAQDRTNTADLLAHIAEVDARRLFAPAGYSSMHAYCVEHLKLSDDSTWKRLQVARQGRKFPQILAALADGRVHLSGLVLLAPHFTADNVELLIAEAAGLRKSEIEALVASRFQKTEILRLDDGIDALPSVLTRPASGQFVAAPVVTRPAPGQVVVPRVEPAGPQRFNVQVTIDQETHDLLRQAQDLLGHAVPSGDVSQVLHRALKVYVEELKKRKFAKTDKPRKGRPARRSRTIPAEVQRIVSERDGYQCTYESEDGHRCRATRRLEFDHAIPLARGGTSTVNNLRLRCDTHNQMEAERVFGRDFMEEKRSEQRGRPVDSEHAPEPV